MRMRQTPISIRKLHHLDHPEEQIRPMQLITSVLTGRMLRHIPHHQVPPPLTIQIVINQLPVPNRQLLIMSQSQLTIPQQMPFPILRRQPRYSPNKAFKSFIKFFISTVAEIFISSHRKRPNRILTYRFSKHT